LARKPGRKGAGEKPVKRARPKAKTKPISVAVAAVPATKATIAPQKMKPRLKYAVYALPFALVIIFLALAVLYSNNRISATTLSAISTIITSLLFSAFAFAYLAMKGIWGKDMLKALRLDNFRPKLNIVLAGLLLFAIVLISELALGIFQVLTNVQLPTNVGAVLAGLPVYVLIFSVFIAPINEEILFRGFLVPRFGIILSALVFALPHLIIYSSFSELIGAFIFGLAAGYMMKKTNSLYPSIIAHILVNAIAVLPLIMK
jgi:uncharacterized protein